MGPDRSDRRRHVRLLKKFVASAQSVGFLRGAPDYCQPMKNDAEPRASPPAELVVEGIEQMVSHYHTITHALDHVSFRVAGGEFVCFVGPSGCGNSAGS